MATVKELLNEKQAMSQPCPVPTDDGAAARSALQRTLNAAESHALGARVDSLLTQVSIENK